MSLLSASSCFTGPLCGLFPAGVFMSGVSCNGDSGTSSISMSISPVACGDLQHLLLLAARPSYVFCSSQCGPLLS